MLNQVKDTQTWTTKAHVQTIEGSQAPLSLQSVCVLIYLQPLTCARLGISVEAFTKIVIRRHAVKDAERLATEMNGCSYLPFRDGIKTHWSLRRQKLVVTPTWRSIEQLRPDAEAQL
jgi:hypothetical protein